jgi:hypothetical protein
VPALPWVAATVVKEYQQHTQGNKMEESPQQERFSNVGATAANKLQGSNNSSGSEAADSNGSSMSLRLPMSAPPVELERWPSKEEARSTTTRRDRERALTAVLSTLSKNGTL